MSHSHDNRYDARQFLDNLFNPALTPTPTPSPTPPSDPPKIVGVSQPDQRTRIRPSFEDSAAVLKYVEGQKSLLLQERPSDQKLADRISKIIGKPVSKWTVRRVKAYLGLKWTPKRDPYGPRAAKPATEVLSLEDVSDLTTDLLKMMTALVEDYYHFRQATFVRARLPEPAFPPVLQSFRDLLHQKAA